MRTHAYAAYNTNTMYTRAAYIHTRMQHMIYIINNRNIHTHTYAVFIMCASLSHQSCARILIRHYAFILHSSNILYTHIHTYTASCAYCTIATRMCTHTHANSICKIASYMRTHAHAAYYTNTKNTCAAHKHTYTN